MLLYLSHSSQFDFKTELYGPIKSSSLGQNYELIFPHETEEFIDAKRIFDTQEHTVVIAEASFPSTGQGVELGWAVDRSIPIIALYREGMEVSDSIKRVARKLVPYGPVAEIPSLIAQAIKEVVITPPRPKVFVGCGLTYVPSEFIAEIGILKKHLSETYEVLEFAGLHQGTPEYVTTTDSRAVRECDLFIAECSFPSTGLGFELGIAITLNKPILAIAKADAKITRMILGIKHPNFNLIHYTNMTEVETAIAQKVKEIYK